MEGFLSLSLLISCPISCLALLASSEKIARSIAVRMQCGIVVDAFAGAGGNTIQFAQTCNQVIAIDNSALRIENAKHNAAVYGVLDKIDFVLGDAFTILPSMKGKVDAVFLSPPWGGPSYTKDEHFKLETMTPYNAFDVLNLALSVTPNVAFLLPRNTQVDEVRRFLEFCDVEGDICEMQFNYLCGSLKTITVYFGNIMFKEPHTSQ